MSRNPSLAALSLFFWILFQNPTVWGNGVLPETTPSVPESDATFFRGHLVIGPTGGTFTQCDTNSKLAIIDRTGGELRKVCQELTSEPEAGVYVEVLGRKSQRSEKEGKELTILKLYHAATETRGCAEDLNDFSYKAAGNEPFWQIIITSDKISFSQMGKPEIVFPWAPPSITGNDAHLSTEMAGPSPQRLSIDIREKTCRDTMSGAYFSLSARVRLDNSEYNGCARQGLLQKDQHTNPQNNSMTIKALRNAEYFSEWSSTGKVQLVNGIYREKIVPGSATELDIRLGEKVAFGDLDNDGANEAAAILITGGGGSGTFYDLVVLADRNGSPKHIATAFLGDRVRVQSLAIQAGHILVEMYIQGPDDPMASPSLLVRKRFKLQGERLVPVDKN